MMKQLNTLYQKVSPKKSCTKASSPDGPMSTSKEHIILLDWDDTLLPTSYLLKNMDTHIDTAHKYKIFKVKKDINKAELISSMKRACHAALDLLQTLLRHFKSSNIKLVTNSTKGWVFESLLIATSVCKGYAKVAHLLVKHKIEIIYARNRNMHRLYWKTQCFALILEQLCNSLNQKYVIVTIGDQWTDHSSIRQSTTYCRLKQNIFHHQLKFLASPDCSYLCVELKCVKNLIEPKMLSQFHAEGMVLEFDGYE